MYLLQTIFAFVSLLLDMFFSLLDAEWKGPERGHVRGNTALL